MPPACLAAGALVSAAAADPEALLALAVALAEDAGDLLLRRWGEVHTVAAKTSATDPVSDADRASEELIAERIRSARPDDSIEGEEGAAHAGSSGLRWVVDPLDGTVNYLYGFPAWCVSVACADEQGAVVGAVRDPVHAETFQAVRGGGAFLGAQRLAVNDPVALPHALIATGFGYDPELRGRQGARAGRLLPQVRDIRRAGSAALDLCALAAGRVDGYYEDHLSPWDWAAGSLIAAEAGATVHRDGPLLVAAGPALAEPLQAAVTAAHR